MDARRPYFLEVFLPNLSLKRLKIPVKFIKHLEGRTSGSVTLVGPSGGTWDVNLRKQNNGLCLDDGWPTFVKDHSIQSGDSLVFRYDGDLNFAVQIFDQTSCEKEEAFYAECSSRSYDCNGLVGKKRERDVIASLANLAADNTRKKVRGNHANGYKDFDTANQYKTISEDEHEPQSPCSSIQDKVSMASRNAVVWAMTSRCDADQQEVVRRGKSRTTVNKKSSVSAFIEKQATQHFTSRFPYFVRVMKSSNVSGSGTLKLPVLFSTQYLPKGRTQVVLKNLKGDCWTLSSVPTVRSHIMHTLCGGWTAFVRDNDIKMEDICIFELVGDREMCVRVLRLDLEGLDWEKLKVGFGSSALCSPKLVDSKKTKGKYNESESKPRKSKYMFNDPESKRDEMSMSLSGAAKQRSMKSSSFLTGNTLKGGSTPFDGKILSNHSNNRDKLGLHSGAAAIKSTDEGSPFPSFVKVMRYSNVGGPYTLSIPSKFAVPHFPSCRTEIILQNSKGECWTVNSLPSSSRCTGHTLCGGWMAFVRGNNLKIGDTCLFELVGKAELRVNILKKGDSGANAEESTADVSSPRFTTSDE